MWTNIEYELERSDKLNNNDNSNNNNNNKYPCQKNNNNKYWRRFDIQYKMKIINC